jgi:dTDP-4-dehydrorhamnose 3,5-epimerase-like enzyme
MNVEIINLPKINDPRGNLSFVEKNIIPFLIKRVYFLYDVPSGAERGGHAHIEQDELLIATSGSFDVVLNDGKSVKTVTLNNPSKGLLINKMIWRELKNFSSGSVCLVLASDTFSESDYIRNFNDFLTSKS